MFSSYCLLECFQSSSILLQMTIFFTVIYSYYIYEMLHIHNVFEFIHWLTLMVIGVLDTVKNTLRKIRGESYLWFTDLISNFGSFCLSIFWRSLFILQRGLLDHMDHEVVASCFERKYTLFTAKATAKIIQGFSFRQVLTSISYFAFLIIAILIGVR